MSHMGNRNCALQTMLSWIPVLVWETPEKFYKGRLFENLVSVYTKIEKEDKNYTWKTYAVIKLPVAHRECCSTKFM